MRLNIDSNFRKLDRNRILKPDIRSELDSAGYPVGAK